VAYIFMAVHHPAAGHREEIYRRMRDMAAGLAGTAGLIDIGPWLDAAGDRVIGLSMWESREAFEAAMPGSGVPNDTVHDGESRPREYFHLTDAAP